GLPACAAFFATFLAVFSTAFFASDAALPTDVATALAASTTAPPICAAPSLNWSNELPEPPPSLCILSSPLQFCEPGWIDFHHENRWTGTSAGGIRTDGRRDEHAPACGLELAVIAFLECIEQIGRGVRFAIVLDLFIALDLHHGTVLELEAVGGVGQIMLLHQHSLEGRRVEAEGGAPLQSLAVGVGVDVLEVFVGV